MSFKTAINFRYPKVYGYGSESCVYHFQWRSLFLYLRLKITAEWLVLLLHILEVQGSNFGLETFCPD
jgi:hypothetical protein